MNITIDETKEPKQGEEKQKSPRFKVIQDKDGKQAVIVEHEDGTQEKMGAFENPFAGNLSEDENNELAGHLSTILNMARIGAAEKGKEAVIDDALKDALSFANIHNATKDGNTKEMISALLGAKLPPLEGFEGVGELMAGFADSLRSTLAEEVFNDLKLSFEAQQKLIDETMAPIQKQIASSMEIMKEYTAGISEVQEQLRKLYEENPLYFLALEELAKMKDDPEYSGIDENTLVLEYEDEGRTIVADTLQNKAIEEAWRRAEERYAQEEQDKQEEQEKQPSLFDDLIEEPAEEPTEEGRLEGKSLTSQKQLTSNLAWAMHHMRGIINNGYVDVSATHRKKQITTRFQVDTIEGVEIKGLDSLTGYENEVANGLYTLYENGFRSFTIPKLLEAMTLDPGVKASTETQKKLEKILEKFDLLRLSIDATKEFRLYTDDKTAIYKERRHFFDLEWKYVKLGGVKVKMYFFTGAKEPILLEHAKKTGNKIIAMPKNLLQIKDRKGHVMSDTENRIAIKGYLFRRIRQMRDKDTGELKKSQSNRILFASMYEDTHLQANDRSTEKAYRDSAIAILEHWQREGEFKRFEIVKGGRGGAVKGVDIFFK